MLGLHDVLDNVTAVLMAKRPDPGAVKTRLTDGGVLSAQAAAGLYRAMLACIAHRLGDGGRLVLAVTPDGCGDEMAGALRLASKTVILDQGPGDLGRRMDRAWRVVAADRPVAFFGGDSPDVPDEALAAIPVALREADVAVGPTPDGGYWTLAARTYQPSILAEIDWGTGNVYDQTCRRATTAGLTICELPVWHDVDRPQDVGELRRRLQAGPTPMPSPLRLLADRLETLLA